MPDRGKRPFNPSLTYRIRHTPRCERRTQHRRQPFSGATFLPLFLPLLRRAKTHRKSCPSLPALPIKQLLPEAHVRDLEHKLRQVVHVSQLPGGRLGSLTPPVPLSALPFHLL